MKSRPRVIVVGALGRMGRQAVDTFLQNSDQFELVAGLVRNLNHVDKKVLQEFEGKVRLSDNLEKELDKSRLDILVELTTPDSVFLNSKLALQNGVRPVIGATGLSNDDIQELAKISDRNSTGAIIAPNFSIGAILMMKFSALAAQYMDRFEIVERHHDQKLDSPSGTAIKTAKLIKDNAKKPNQATFKDQPARGQLFYDVPIHSIRLQGFMADQEVIFGGQGQTLSIQHSTIDRSGFMPGIVMACQKVMGLNKLVYGLENLV